MDGRKEKIMNTKLTINKEIYEENFKIAKKAFVLNSGMEASACAASFIGDTQPTSAEDMKAAKKILNKSTSVVSILGRGNARQVVTATLARSGNPEDAMEKIIKIHKALDKKFFNSDYLVLAAVIIYRSCKPSEYDVAIQRTREIYKLIRKDHPLITGREDIVNCAMMAISGIDVNKLASDCEDSFKALNKLFFGKNKIQYMACVLSLFDEDAVVKAEKTRLTRDLLKSEGVRFDSDAYAIIGAVAMIVDDKDKKRIAKEIKNTSDEIKSIRGMGPVGAGKRIRNLIATALVLDAYAGSASGVASLAINAIITAIIIAEAAAVAAATTAAASSAAASS